MYSVRTDAAKNRLYLELSDFFSVEAAQAASAEVKAAIGQLQPGFDFVSDTRDFKPSSPQVTTIIAETQTYVNQHGIGRFVRIVSANIIGQMQFERVSRMTGLTVYNVTSLEEAEALLDE